MHRAIIAKSAAPRTRQTSYPPEFAQRIAGRVKRPLGDLFTLRNFGVNLTTLSPGGSSALFHRHSRQDEFIYVVEGDVVLVTDNGEQHLEPGMWWLPGRRHSTPSHQSLRQGCHLSGGGRQERWGRGHLPK